MQVFALLKYPSAPGCWPARSFSITFPREWQAHSLGGLLRVCLSHSELIHRRLSVALNHKWSFFVSLVGFMLI